MNTKSVSKNTTVHTDGRLIWVNRGEECAVRIANIDKLMQYPDFTHMHCTILSQTSNFVDAIIEEPYSEEELIQLIKEYKEKGFFRKTEMTKEEILKNAYVHAAGRKVWINTDKGCAVRIRNIDKLMQSTDFTKMDCTLNQNANFVDLDIEDIMNT
ncbi:MAG: hypothetical protein AWU59_1251 [Methanolobus sp. T82-4]|jgi:hypothetical protein|nr:MAG: hypothetical protein AWU59_1251 [Methanolobus sp. T82-4]